MLGFELLFSHNIHLHLAFHPPISTYFSTHPYLTERPNFYLFTTFEFASDTAEDDTLL